ncbi:hypothetical protein L218DRAFT_1000056 [Marasmius fiardii PR-910]|nr:hypothetical protein L218DRAFT_1000056 [Marasmius fiardii PR-910]
MSDRIPELSYMGGDFNCHSSKWDPSFQGSTGGRAEELLLLVATLGLGRSECENPGPTFIPQTQGSRSSVLDLVFVTSDEVLSTKSRREVDLKGPSDHVLVSIVLDLGRSPLVEIRTLPKGGEQEEAFLEHLSDGPATFASQDMSSPELLSLEIPDHMQIQTVVKSSKRTFFDDRIKEKPAQEQDTPRLTGALNFVNIPNTARLCTCWSPETSQSAVVQTRTHVLHHCPDVKHSKNIDYVVGLAQFLKKNPRVFSFADPAPRAGVG